MKTYFNYNQTIASKDLCEAISMVHGASPIIGFGQATIDSTNRKLTVKPLPLSTDPLYQTMVDRRKQWNIYKGSTEGDQTNFAGITRDGYIFGTDEESIEVTISGSKGVNNEVLLFAYHMPITEPVENPVTFLAYWSESNESFFELYQKSIDPYYPTALADRSINYSSNSSNSLSYDSLLTKVNKACDYYQKNQSSLVLIGIYGTGTNEVTDTEEDFALVPYNGDFPVQIPFSTRTKSALEQSISRIESIIGANTSLSGSGTTSISELLSAMKAEIMAEVKTEISLAALPSGSIILWSGSTIPDGWEIYTPASGRVVFGYRDGGIEVPAGITGTATQSILTSVGATYDPAQGHSYNTPISGEDLPGHTHGIGISNGKRDNAYDEDGAHIQNWASRDTSLKGNVGEAAGAQALNVVNGAVLSGKNTATVETLSDGFSTVTQLNANKVPKAIALYYIIKK